ncbi:DMT family transporter [Tateyamaria sp. SN3-11]|uniref:DMT family transporter n=1 Tax=Tateyamaria sp. SN3-11 TaxID=3092147 RepID=UPI0039EC475A
MTKLRIAAAIILSVLSWAVTFPMITFAVAHLDPIPLAAVRFACAGLVCLIWLFATQAKVPKRQDFGTLLLFGMTGTFLYNVLLNTGQRTISPGAASFIIGTVPILTMLLSWGLRKERIGKRVWFGAGVSLCGLACIATVQPGGVALGSGASLAFGAALSSAVFFMVQQPLVRSYGALTCTAYAVIIGGVLLLPWLGTGVRQILAEPAATLRILLPVIVFMALFSAFLAHASWAYVVAQLGPSVAARFLYLTPPTALMLEVVWTRAWPGSLTIIGGALAIIGVVLASLPRSVSATVKGDLP